VANLRPEDLGFADRAPWQFDVSATLAAAPAEVWSAFTDNTSWTAWYATCRVCRTTSTATEGLGMTRYIEVDALKAHEQVIAWEPERLWAFTVTELGRPFCTAMVERATFAASSGGGTDVTYRMASEPRWWARPLKRVIADRMRKAWIASFDELDHYLAGRRDRPGDSGGSGSTGA
jgi:uncharacterized protein YndB with AHSA1/START domain